MAFAYKRQNQPPKAAGFPLPLISNPNRTHRRVFASAGVKQGRFLNFPLLIKRREEPGWSGSGILGNGGDLILSVGRGH